MCEGGFFPSRHHHDIKLLLSERSYGYHSSYLPPTSQPVSPYSAESTKNNAAGWQKDVPENVYSDVEMERAERGGVVVMMWWSWRKNPSALPISIYALVHKYTQKLFSSIILSGAVVVSYIRAAKGGNGGSGV